MNTIIKPTVTWTGRDRFGMPGDGYPSELRVAASGATFVQHACVLVDGRTAVTDAVRNDFPGTPAWSPPI